MLINYNKTLTNKLFFLLETIIFSCINNKENIKIKKINNIIIVLENIQKNKYILNCLEYNYFVFSIDKWYKSSYKRNFISFYTLIRNYHFLYYFLSYSKMNIRKFKFNTYNAEILQYKKTNFMQNSIYIENPNINLVKFLTPCNIMYKLMKNIIKNMNINFFFNNIKIEDNYSVNILYFPIDKFTFIDVLKKFKEVFNVKNITNTFFKNMCCKNIEIYIYGFQHSKQENIYVYINKYYIKYKCLTDHLLKNIVKYFPKYKFYKIFISINIKKKFNSILNFDLIKKIIYKIFSY